MNDKAAVKVGALAKDESRSAWSKYRALQYGPMPLGQVVWAECLFTLFGPLPGAAGLFFRKVFYPDLLGACGRGVVFGRNVVLRHPSKIRLGDGVIVDDNAVLDAKGEGNEGITIGAGSYIGRNTIVYCKGGAIRLGEAVNVSSNCQLYASNELVVGKGTVIGAYTYLMSGGAYDRESVVPFAEQAGMETRGPLTVGANCWLGARVTVLDAACVGDHAVIGAGAVVTRPVPGDSVAVGVPARVVKGGG